jgi:hypothetical protein
MPVVPVLVLGWGENDSNARKKTSTCASKQRVHKTSLQKTMYVLVIFFGHRKGKKSSIPICGNGGE